MTKTQKIRTNRPDGRAISAQRRRSADQSVCKKEIIQDIRVTTQIGKKTKTREVNATAMPLRQSSKEKKAETLHKQIRNVRKKLKSIEDLLKKQTEGVELNELQNDKIDSMEDVINELTRLVSEQSEL
jgi:uncharacterized protein with WD repeat